MHEYYYQMFLDTDTDTRATQLKELSSELYAFINETNCHPILVRLAWHDSGTFDQRIPGWPQRGGANGGIIFDTELKMGANNGLPKAVTYLKKFKEKYPAVSWADLIQMASALAVEAAGGPVIDMRYGRVSVEDDSQCAKPTSREGFAGNAGLPDAKPPFGCGATSAADHLRNVFTKKMGFTDQEIVALSGAHTIGRAFKERSGTCPFGYTDAGATKHTKSTSFPRGDGQAGVGMAGGASWTTKWLSFDNSYFKEYKQKDPHLLWFPTDDALTTDPAFKPFFEAFAADQSVFFKEYAAAHKKLSELGAKFSPPEGIKL